MVRDPSFLLSSNANLGSTKFCLKLGIFFLFSTFNMFSSVFCPLDKLLFKVNYEDTMSKIVVLVSLLVFSNKYAPSQ